MLEPDAFDALVARFARLGRADRDAVMAALSPGEREQVMATIAHQTRTRHEAAATSRHAGRQYAAYSPWLSAIVRQAVADDGLPGVITERTRRALVDAHQSGQGRQNAPPASLWDQVRRLGERLIDGEAGAL